MSYKVDNAVIMAAGTSSRFAPLSFEKPKALISVKNEILIERQIRQLQEAGIPEIIIVVGYKKEQFYYLKNKYSVKIVENNDFLTRNNNASIYAVRDYLCNSYVCSADNYFTINPFEAEVDDSYYAALYANGSTAEWCLTEDKNGYIDTVQIGGDNTWYMMGHTFWNKDFSAAFLNILLQEYNLPKTSGLLWESIYKEHLDTLKMKLRRYHTDEIFEFDTLDELREFDKTYIHDTRSCILKNICQHLSCTESDITQVNAVKDISNEAIGFTCVCRSKQYQYEYETQSLRRKNDDR